MFDNRKEDTVSLTEQVIRTEVFVAGLGFGGVETHLYLEKWGIKDYVIVEKADGPGGVWRKNTYPGVSNDINPRQYSIGGKYIDTTPERFPDGQSTLRYLEGFAKKHKLDRTRLRFKTRLYSLQYNDETGEWTAKTKNVGANGETEGPTYIAKFVILATGQLDKPFTPEIPGQQVFRGPAFHTAKWEHSHDLRGKKIAVIGTGPSAAQLIPELAKIADVTVYQRTANWVLPRPSSRYRWATASLLSRSVTANRIFRLIGQVSADLVLSPITSRGWSAAPLEWVSLQQLRHQVPDPKLREKLTPDFPLGCKRPVISSSYYPAFARSNVRLVTEPIEEVTETGVATNDGLLHKADVIVYATGFQTTNFYPDIDIRGRDGLSLKEDVWKDGPEAYLGTAPYGMPNLFFLAGPGAFIGSASNPTMKEKQLHLIGNVITLARSWQDAAIEVSLEAMERYRSKRAKIIRKSVLLKCTSWYRDAAGRAINPYGGSLWSFHRETRRNPKKDFRRVPLTRK